MNIDGRTALNGVALIVVALLAGMMVFHAVPDGNTNLISTIIGGVLGFLTGNAVQPPKPPTGEPHA